MSKQRRLDDATLNINIWSKWDVLSSLFNQKHERNCGESLRDLRFLEVISFVDYTNWNFYDES